MTEKDVIFWEEHKANLLNNIDKALENNSENSDVLEIMKELLNQIKVVNTMEDYYNEYDK